MTLVADTSNQWLLIDMDSHLVISAQVTDRSWLSELADTSVVDPILVESIQMVSHETSADLPIPRPDAVAILNVSKSTLPLFCLMCSPRSRNTSRCHLRGPVKCSSGVFGWPHGNVIITNASGSFLIWGDQRRDINAISPSASYLVVCMRLLDVYLAYQHG